MSTHFIIAGLQLALEAKGNLEEVTLQIRDAVTVRPDIQMVVVSELATEGVGTKSAESLPSPTERHYRALAKELGIWLLPGSLYESTTEGVFNTIPVINPDGEVVLRYRKMFPFYPFETGVQQGAELGIFDVPGVGRFGVANCYDIWFPELTRALMMRGAEVIINPVLTNTDDRPVELAIVRATAVQQQCYVVSVNGAMPFARGHSLAVDPHGRVIHQLNDTPDVMVIDIQFDQVAQSRSRGMLDLGQTLKSFRDSHLSLSHYQKIEESTVLSNLGALAKAKK